MSLTLTLERGGGEVSGSGTQIELEGTGEGYSLESVTMNGNTEQTTIPGGQLLTKDGMATPTTDTAFWQTISTTLTMTPKDNGWCNITQSTSGYGNFQASRPAIYNFTESTTYTLIFEVANVSGASNGYIQFVQPAQVQDAFGSFSIVTGASDGDSDNVRTNLTNPDAVSVLVVKTKSSFASNTRGLRTYTGGNTTVGATFDIRATVLLGDHSSDWQNYVGDNWKPYVGGVDSPNPDYPQEVETVTGRQVVTISDGGSESQEYEINLGKNILDNYNPTVVSNNTTWTPTANGGLYTATSSWTGGVKWRLTVETGTTYQFQYKERTDQNLYLYITTYTDATYTTIKTRFVNDGRNTIYPIVPDSPYLEISFNNSAAMTDVAIEELMFEKATTRTSYAPYFTPIELCKIGDYQDYIYKSGDDWYIHKATGKVPISGDSYTWLNGCAQSASKYPTGRLASSVAISDAFTYNSVQSSITTNLKSGEFGFNTTEYATFKWSGFSSVSDFNTWVSNNNPQIYYVLTSPTDTQITDSSLVAQLEALNAGDTYDGKTVITVSSENLAGSLDVTVSSNITKTYTEVEIGSPFTIADVEGKSSNTTLDGNVYVDWAYNKKQYSFDLFNLTPQDYADIRAYYDYQFSNSAFPTITVPELDIDKLPVYMEISSRNIINQCLLTDKLTIKFRETVQP